MEVLRIGLLLLTGHAGLIALYFLLRAGGQIIGSMAGAHNGQRIHAPFFCVS